MTATSRYPGRAIVFDIETVIDTDYVEDPVRLLDLQHSYEPPESYRDPVKVAGHHSEWWEKERKAQTFSPLTAKVIAIAWADLWSGDVHCVVSDDEVEVLEAFAEGMLGAKEQRGTETVLTGYNVRKFDVPFVTTRASLQSVVLPWWWPHEHDYRRIADVMDVTRRGKCQDWLERCGLPLKTGEGGAVWKMTLDQVREYCTNDVHVERLLAQRFAPNMNALRATQPKDDYQEIPA